MSKKKKAIIISSVASGVLLLAGAITMLCLFFCRKPGETIAKAENDYAPVYHSYCTYEHDADMMIDGILEESQWQDKQWFSNTYLANTKGNMPVLKVTGFPTEYGIYIAAIAEDENLRNDGQRSPGMNSNFEFYVSANNVGEVRANDALNRVQFNIDLTGDAYTAVTDFDRAVVVDGEINSGATTSATLEMFVPWEVLSVDTSLGIPETFGIMPAYRGVLLGKESTAVLSPVGFVYNKPKDFFVFNKDGYINADREGAVVGDGKFGQTKSANWDISREAEGIVESSTGTEYHRIFFSGEYGSDFLVETTMIPVKSLENDYARAGIVFQAPDNTYFTVFLDLQDAILTEGMNGTKTPSTLQLFTLDSVRSAWNMVSFSSYARTNDRIKTQEGVKLTVLKQGARFWYFINGTFVTSEEIDFMDKEVFPGFYALGADVIYKDYSCMALNDDMLKSYLNERELYLVDARVASAGGEVHASAATVKKGGSYDITITSKSGYEVSSILVNGEERIDDAKKKAKGGVYTITGAESNQEVRVSFVKCEGSTLAGTVKDKKNGGDLSAKVIITGETGRLLRYEVSAAGTKGFTVTLPDGTYQMCIETEGYKTFIGTVKVSGDIAKEYSLEPSDFPATVQVNGKTVTSQTGKWNLTEEHLGKVSTSYDMGGKLSPLYFNKTAKDFVIEASIDYTTGFAKEKEYQKDLWGGFIFSDGSNTGWIMARQSGIAYTGWKYETNLIDYNVLTYPEKKTADFAVAKKGTKVFIYFEGEFVKEMDWSAVAPGISPDSEVVPGLLMLADKTADIAFRNYSVRTGTEAAEKYIADHVSKDSPLSENAMFAKAVTVNGVQLKSQKNKWNLSEAANGRIKGSFALGTKMKPLYFNVHGTTALMQATIEYTTEFAAGGEYQQDLWGGFTFSDGKNSGWIMARKTGITYTGWNHEENLVSDAVLTYPEKRSVQMTVAYKDNYFYVYFDNVYLTRLKASRVVKGTGNDTDLAFGLYMLADKIADIKFSNISVTTNAEEVASYISGHKQ